MYITEVVNVIEQKQCNKCKQYLYLSNFYTNTYNNKIFYRNTCKTCKNKQDANRTKGTLNRWVTKSFSASKIRSLEKGLDHTITKQWIVDNLPKFCPVLGIELSFNGDKYNSPSLDRFDNNKGYTTDNVRIISYRANTLKNNGTLEELEAIVRYMKNEQISIDSNSL